MTTAAYPPEDWNVRKSEGNLVISSSDPELLDKTMELLRLLRGRLKEIDREQMEELIENMANMLAPVPDPATVYQARRNAEARAELLRRFGALTSTEIHDLYGARAANKAALATRWRREGKIFAVHLRGEKRYPAFQFDASGKPLPVIARVLDVFDEDTSEWQITLWFIMPNGWLGGKRPVDLLELDPDTVVDAARDEVEPGAY